MKWKAILLVLFFTACVYGDDMPFNKNTWDNRFDKRFGEEETSRQMSDALAIITASNIKLYVEVLPIGDWDMDAVIGITVPITMNPKNIVSASVHIKGDPDVGSLKPLNVFGGLADGEAQGGWVISDNYGIELLRLAGGTFDSVNYDATTFNRGWIVIWYIA